MEELLVANEIDLIYGQKIINFGQEVFEDVIFELESFEKN